MNDDPRARHLRRPERSRNGRRSSSCSRSRCVWLRERIQESIARAGDARYCAGFGSCRSEYDVRDHTLTPGRFTSFTSILRVRFSGSGLVDE